MLAIENLAYNFCRKLISLINSNFPTEFNTDVLMPKYNKILLDRYNDTTFLLRQITEQHQNHAWNHISALPRYKRGIISAIHNFPFG